jgi:hypothetical protein
MRRIIRSRFGPKMAPLAVLRFEGRRTGRRREIPVGLHEVDGAHAVFTDRPWRLNFRQAAPMTVLQRGETWSATAELIDDPERVGPALAAAVAREGARKLGLAVHGDQTPTAEDFAATGKSMILIRRAAPPA